jgi:hypothetical protein
MPSFWPFGKKKEEKAAEEAPAEQSEQSGPPCSFCGRVGADRKFGGQWWHKKCLRNGKKEMRK